MLAKEVVLERAMARARTKEAAMERARAKAKERMPATALAGQGERQLMLEVLPVTRGKVARDFVPTGNGGASAKTVVHPSGV